MPPGRVTVLAQSFPQRDAYVNASRRPFAQPAGPPADARTGPAGGASRPRKRASRETACPRIHEPAAAMPSHEARIDARRSKQRTAAASKRPRPRGSISSNTASAWADSTNLRVVARSASCPPTSGTLEARATSPTIDTRHKQSGPSTADTNDQRLDDVLTFDDSSTLASVEFARGCPDRRSTRSAWTRSSTPLVATKLLHPPENPELSGVAAGTSELERAGNSQLVARRRLLRDSRAATLSVVDIVTEMDETGERWPGR
jgi:hypothetical protein